MIDWSASRLVEVLTERYAPHENAVHACWVVATTGRTAMACALSEAQMPDGMTVVPVVVSGSSLFTSANAVTSDLMTLLENQRAQVEEAVRNHRHNDTLVLVLLSLESLSLPQVASPCELPNWIPEHGGTCPPLCIDDLARDHKVSCGAPEAEMPGLCAAAYHCDRSITARFRLTLDRSPQVLSAFCQDLGLENVGVVAVSDFIEAAGRTLDAVSTPHAYRPSLARARTPLSMIGRLVSAKPLDKLPKIGGRFLDALYLSDEEANALHVSLAALLMRAASSDVSHRRLIGANLIQSMYATIQFTTACAHGDAYPRQTPAALSAASRDLQETLGVLTQQLRLITKLP